jgi:uncharacterized protein YcaQ
MSRSISIVQARRIALGAQGFRDPAPRTVVDRRHLRRVMGRLKLLQLDSVPVVIRTQYMPMFSRLGQYRPELLDRMAYRDDEWFEAWAHEASLLPVEDEPLLRWSKARSRAGETWKGLVELAEREPGYVAEVLAQVAERPLVVGELADQRPREGEWWGTRSLGALALDWLFRIGEIGIRRRAGFTKEFDLLDRIVPPNVRCRPTPSEEESHRELLMRSAAALGVGTATDLIDYYRLPVRPGRARLAELVEDGRLVEIEVEGWAQPGFLHPEATRPRAVPVATVLSPFDPVVWNRERAERLWDFQYRIEIYTPAARRVYGYYVMPVLVDERIVGRLDLKTDRDAGVLRVQGAYSEPGVDRDAIAERIRPVLAEMAEFVGVDGYVVGRRGDLAGALN